MIPALGRRASSDGSSDARAISGTKVPARHGAVPCRTATSSNEAGGQAATPSQEGVFAMTRDLNHAPVVLASDGTPASEGALRFAVQESGVRGAGLVIVHVNPMAVPVPPLRPILPIGPVPATRPTLPSEFSMHARRVLDRIAREARELAPGLSVSTVLMDGRRVRAIVDAAADAQLVVVGRETRHGLERAPHRVDNGGCRIGRPVPRGRRSRRLAAEEGRRRRPHGRGRDPQGGGCR